MHRRELVFLILKGFAAWVLCSFGAWYFGEWLFNALFPLLKVMIKTMMPEVAPGLKLVKPAQSQFHAAIELSALALRPVYLNAGHYIPPGAELKSAANLLHALVPLVIEGVILFVWPVRLWSQRLLLIALGMLTSVMVLMAILPAQLLGNLEISFQETALSGQNPRPVPWFVDWMVFCEMGGRWLLGIISAWFCIQLQRRWLP